MGDAGRAWAGGALRPLPPTGRSAGCARRSGGGGAVLPVDGRRLLDRRGRALGSALVPALRNPRPRLHARADRPGAGRTMWRTAVHGRLADAWIALSRLPLGPDGIA